MWDTRPMKEHSDRGTGRTGRATGLWLGAGAVAGAAVTVGVAFLAVAILVTPPAAAGAAPHFVEEAQAAGLAHVYDGDFTFFVGGGVAVFDCNDDGRPDLYFAGGTNPAALFRNTSSVGGALQFEPIPQESTDLTRVTGAFPLDVDSDGVVDLAVLRVGENVILRGTGDCHFERANEIWGIDGGNEWTAAFSAMWEGDADLPTLAFGNYLELDENGEQTGNCSDHAFVRPDGADGYAAPVALHPGWCTLSILFSDWDRTGTRDLRMTNDRHYYRDGEDQLWHVIAGEMPRPYTHEEGWQQMRIWGMGIASQDLTGDGRPEVFLTSQGDNRLQTLADGSGEPSFSDIALQSGATATRPFAGDINMPSTAWHPEFEDVNNDGYFDLYISKGNVEAMPGYAEQDTNDLLLGGPDGVFTESAASAGIVNFAKPRGAALADFNLDGMLDLVEVNRRENVTLWRNLGSGDGNDMGNWIAVRLDQQGANRNAIGSWIEVDSGGKTVQREITVGGGHASGQLGWIHFGLGDAGAARVRVQWPDGEQGPWLDIDANHFGIIERGESAIQLWEPTTG